MKSGSDFIRKAGISAILIIIAAYSYNSSAQTYSSWHASSETVEKLSKERPEFNYYEEKVPSYTLPDPLISRDGKRVVKPDLWNTSRRTEIIELFRQNVFGRVPETPYTR